MSSLWTPDGEHKVPRPEEPGPEGPRPSSLGRPGTGGSPPPEGRHTRPPISATRADDEQPNEEELRQLARQLAEAPVEDVVANHCYGLFELAALHLSQRPVDLASARLAIDAMGRLVDGLGERLGPHTRSLADGLTQLRLAFVRVADAAAAAQDAAAGSGNGKSTGTPTT